MVARTHKQKCGGGGSLDPEHFDQPSAHRVAELQILMLDGADQLASVCSKATAVHPIGMLNDEGHGAVIAHAVLQEPCRSLRAKTCRPQDGH